MSTFSNINLSIGKAINTVSTISDLRNYKPIRVKDGDVVIVSAAAILGDSDGGTFVWVEGSTVADDGGNTIKPVFAVGSGRWVKAFGKGGLGQRGPQGDRGLPSTVPGPQGEGLATVMAPGGSALVGYRDRTVKAKLDEVISVKDAGAKGDGTTVDLAAILNAAISARTSTTDGTGRVFTGEIKLPPGRYVINGPLDLAPSSGSTGLTVSGSGAGSTEIIYKGAAATIKASSSRAVTFRDLSFVSSNVDDNQTAFSITYGGNPLRSWNFERCDFAAFNQCFNVTGVALCSEFYFDKCGFHQCYQLMNNSNDQAVNWNFVNCNWENEALDSVKPRGLSTPFMLQSGTLVNWTGGSIIGHGPHMYFNLTEPNKVQVTSHAITFTGVRFELEDDAGAGTHSPLIDRTETNYANGGNGPVVAYRSCTILNRGAIPTTITYGKLWNNCNFLFENCQLEGGKIVGIINDITSTQNATLRIVNSGRLDYVEDVTNRVNDHDAHAVSIIPPFNGAEGALMTDVRPSSLTSVASVGTKNAFVRGPTGSIPLSGTTILLNRMPVHTVLLTLYIRAFETIGATLTVELRDQADTTTYATVSAAANDRIVKADIAKEIGFQIPDVPLMFKISGTAQIIKGMIGIEYL